MDIFFNPKQNEDWRKLPTNLLKRFSPTCIKTHISWGNQSQYQTMHAVYNVFGRIHYTRTLIFTFFMTSRQPCAHRHEQGHRWMSFTARAEGIPQLINAHTSPLPLPLSLSSRKIDRKNHPRTKHKSSAPKAKVLHPNKNVHVPPQALIETPAPYCLTHARSFGHLRDNVAQQPLPLPM